MDLRLEKCGCKKSARELEMGAFKLLSQGEKVRPKKHAFICSVFASVDKSMTYAVCVTELAMRVAKFACSGCANLAGAKWSAAQIGCRQTSTMGGRGCPGCTFHPLPL